MFFGNEQLDVIQHRQTVRKPKIGSENRLNGTTSPLEVRNVSEKALVFAQSVVVSSLILAAYLFGITHIVLSF